MKNAHRFAALTGLITMASFAAPPSMDARATQLLRKMTDFLAQQQAFGVETQGVIVVVTKEGQKLDLPFSSRAWVKRPNKLRVERVDEDQARTFFYDGQSFTIYGPEKNLYAQAAAPPRMDEAIDAARDRLGIEAPAADFLYTSAYEGLMDGVSAATYVGKERLNGSTVHHLAFRGQDVDWQVWIEDGPRPVPRRYVITSKKVERAPDFRVDLSNWDFKGPFPDDRFAFRASTGAQKIEFVKRPEAKGTGGSGKEGTK
jgi:hypothetical protein